MRRSTNFAKKHACHHNVALVYWLTSQGNVLAQAMFSHGAMRVNFVKYPV